MFALPDGSGGSDGEIPGFAGERLFGAEGGGVEDGEAEAVLRIADGAVEDEGDAGFTGEDGQGLGVAVAFRRVFNIDGKAVGGELEEGLGSGGDFAEAGAVLDKTPTPITHFGAGGAAFGRGIEDAGVGRGAEAGAVVSGRITEGGGEQVMEIGGIRRKQRFVLFEDVFEQILSGGVVVGETEGGDDVLGFDGAPGFAGGFVAGGGEALLEPFDGDRRGFRYGLARHRGIGRRGRGIRLE